MRTLIYTLYTFLASFPYLSLSSPTASVAESSLSASPSYPTPWTDNASEAYVGYVGDPSGRGTASLIISCLLTLILCVWSALHLNVPQHGTKPVQSLLISIRWIITGVFAPELVVFTAWRQWSSAKLLGNIVRNEEVKPSRAITIAHGSPFSIQEPGDMCTGGPHTSNEAGQYTPKAVSSSPHVSPKSPIISQSAMQNPESVDRRACQAFPLRQTTADTRLSRLEGQAPLDQVQTMESGSLVAVYSPDTKPKPQMNYHRHGSHGWTMTHDFFASTGGFAFEIEADVQNGSSYSFLPPECPRRLTLTARGMALLARCGHLPDVSKAEIADKSKANDLAKALVMIQACWMVIQVIARLAARLPVTLLEVNTIAHV